jgi:hypothetical protein
MPARNRQRDDFQLRDANAELWRLLTGRPAVAPLWRDFWMVWIPSFAVMMLAFAVVGESLGSPGGLAVLAGGGAFSVVLQKVLTRLGVVGPRSRERGDDEGR